VCAAATVLRFARAPTRGILPPMRHGSIVGRVILDICKGCRTSPLHCPGSAKKVVAVFYGFFDASNTHAEAKVWTLCGFVGEEAAFVLLDDAWNKVLDKPCWPKRLKRFHMVDCVHGNGEFVSWSFAERLSMFGELASAIISTPCVGVSSAVITEDFAKLDLEEFDLLKTEGLGTSLDLSLQSVLQRSINLTRQTSDAETIGLLFDNENPENSKRMLDFCETYKGKFGFGKWLAGIGFGDNAQFTPLQAADILAYCTYRYTMLRYPNFPELDFPVLPGFERMVRQTLHDAKGGFDLESMKKLASKAKANRVKNASTVTLSL
jgi:hypothetical protein